MRGGCSGRPATPGTCSLRRAKRTITEEPLRPRSDLAARSPSQPSVGSPLMATTCSVARLARLAALCGCHDPRFVQQRRAGHEPSTTAEKQLVPRTAAQGLPFGHAYTQRRCDTKQGKHTITCICHLCHTRADELPHDRAEAAAVLGNQPWVACKPQHHVAMTCCAFAIGKGPPTGTSTSRWAPLKQPALGCMQTTPSFSNRLLHLLRERQMPCAGHGHQQVGAVATLLAGR